MNITFRIAFTPAMVMTMPAIPIVSRFLVPSLACVPVLILNPLGVPLRFVAGYGFGRGQMQ